MRGRLLIVVTLAWLGACSTEPGRKIQDFLSPSQGRATLEAGLKQYDDGDYADSAKSISQALELGLKDNEKVDAYKHLAFIDCASRRERQCREQFRKALAIDPNLELEPAEAGHPIWGPIFRSLKSSQ